MLTPETFFDVTSYNHQSLFIGHDLVWSPLKMLPDYMNSQNYLSLQKYFADGEPLTQTLVLVDGEIITSKVTIVPGDVTKGQLKVYQGDELLPDASVIMAGAILSGAKIGLGKGVFVEAGALIKSPALLGDHTEVRQGAYLRGCCLTGKRCVIGHVTEVKNTIFLDDAKAGHFAYLGDSILGNDVNLGAGTKLANLRFVKGDIIVKTPTGPVVTGLRKLGAILGDHVQTGCNSVTNPGTLLGKRSMILPNTTVPSGYHPEGSFIR